MPFSTGGRKVVDEADARACLEAMRAAQTNLTDWCARNGVSRRSLYEWRYRLARRESGATKALPPRLSAIEAAKLLETWREEGGDLASFCRRHGISADTMYRWRVRLSPPPSPPRLVEVAVPTPVARYELVAGRVRVLVGDDFTEETLTRLLRAALSC